LPFASPFKKDDVVEHFIPTFALSEGGSDDFSPLSQKPALFCHSPPHLQKVVGASLNRPAAVASVLGALGGGVTRDLLCIVRETA
jgi:hypothetical protein